MGGWLGINSAASIIKKGWIGVDGQAREIKAGWVGVNGVARKIYPRYVRHYHVNNSIYDPERDSDEKDTGYDLSNTDKTDKTNAKAKERYRTTSGGCYTEPWYQWIHVEQIARGYHSDCEGEHGRNITWVRDEGNNDGTPGSTYSQIGICPWCGSEFAYFNHSYDYDSDGITIVHTATKGTHRCTACPSATEKVATDVTCTGTNTDYASQSGTKNSKKQIGYTNGCGYKYGQLIDGE